MGLLLSLTMCLFSRTEDVFGWRPGYLSNIGDERTRKYSEIEFPEEKKGNGIELKDRIFDQKLTKEFKEKYNQRFGQSGAEAAVFVPNSSGQVNAADGQVIYFEEDAQQRRRFGEYMGRRLAEYHVDNYAKNDPDLKPAYELKEKLSKVKLEVSKGYSFNGKYSFSSNSIDIEMKNPYGDLKFIYDFSPDPRLVGDQKDDARLFVGYPISKKLYFETNYSLIQGDTTLVWRRALTPTWQGSLLLSSSPQHELNIDWEKRFIVGVSRSY